MNAPDDVEIPVAVADAIASWQRIFAGRKGANPRDLLRTAAADLWKTLEVDRTVHPVSYTVARQEVCDALQAMAEAAGIGPDDAMSIFASAFKSSSHKSNGQDGSPGHDWDDPDWSLFDDRRGELPGFPVSTMPGAEVIMRAAHGAGVSFDHVAVPLLAIASGVIGTARRIKASRSWTEPAATWAAIVGLSGSGKTPGINVGKRALVEVERNRRTIINEKRRSHEARRESAKLAREQWKAKLKETAEEIVVSLGQYRDVKAAEPMPASAEDPGPFIVPRLFVSDTTIERLSQLNQCAPVWRTDDCR
jgi:hypothetical protein